MIMMRYYNGEVLKINWAKIFTLESENYIFAFEFGVNVVKSF